MRKGCPAPNRGGGAPCAKAAECASGHCVDDVCCDSACTAQCERCDQPDPDGTVDGTCRVAEGQSPPGACPGKGLCVGVCTAEGDCNLPGTTVACDVCRACDLIGGCTERPTSGDDARCGDMRCEVFTTSCVAYEAGPRCRADAECATAGTRGVCTVRLPQPDGTQCWGGEGNSHPGTCSAGLCETTIPDGGLPDSLSDRDDRRSAVCGCSVDGRPASGLALLTLAALALRARRRIGLRS